MRFRCNTCSGRYSDRSGDYEYYHQCPFGRRSAGGDFLSYVNRRDENLLQVFDEKVIRQLEITGKKIILARSIRKEGKGRTSL